MCETMGMVRVPVEAHHADEGMEGFKAVEFVELLHGVQMYFFHLVARFWRE